MERPGEGAGVRLVHALVDLAALAITFGIAGWLLGIIAIPEKLGLRVRLPLSLALSAPATVLIAAPAAGLGVLRVRTLMLGFGVLALLAAWRGRSALRRASAWRPFGLRDRMRRPSPARLRSEAARAVAVVAGLMVGWLAVVGPQLAGARSGNLPTTTTVWYYWNLAKRVMEERSLPATIMEWGSAREFPHEYLTAILHAAATTLLSGGANLAVLELYRVALLLVAMAALYALWRRWLPAWWAWMAAVLAMATVRFGLKFSAYRPETFGLVLVLWSSWLLDEALERRSWRWGALAGLASAIAFLGHAEIWLLTGPLWSGIVVSRALPALLRGARGRRSRPRPAPARTPLARSAAASLLPLLACLAVFGLGVAGVGWSAGSESRLADLVLQRREQTPTVRTNVQASAGATDATWALYSYMANPELLAQEPRTRCGDFFEILPSKFPFTRFNITRVQTWGALLALAAFVALCLPFLPPETRRGLIVLGVVFAGLWAGSQAFCAVYDTYVPRRAGPSRIWPYYVLSVAGLVAVSGYAMAMGVFATLRYLWARRGRLGPRLKAGLAVLSVSTVLLIPLTPMLNARAQPRESGISPAAYEAYTWMSRGLEPGAIVLANAYTDGSLSAISGRVGWLDGRAPFLESREWLVEATNRLAGARAYFQDPIGRAGALPPEVDYVLVARGGANLGGPRFPADMQALGQAPNLERVRGFDGKVVLYRVRRDHARRSPPAGVAPAPGGQGVAAGDSD